MKNCLKKLLMIAFVQLTFLVSAHATLITGVTASTDMGSGFGTSLTNTVNGTGLTSLALDATHSATTPSNSWVSSNTLVGNIDFNLGSLYDVAGFSFWNQNAGGPGGAGSTGIKDVTIQLSIDGINFSNIIGAVTQFLQVPTSTGLPQLVNFSPVQASHIRFVVGSNWGDVSQTGFAEVQFDSAAIPTPAPIALIGLGLAVLGFSRRKTV